MSKLRSSLVGLLGLVLASCGPVQELSPVVDVAAGVDERAPNFVVIVADDLGYCDTGLYRCREVPTPAIDRIAREGVLFTDGYVTAATCSPSRAALLTGRYQQRFGFEFNTGPARITHEEERGLPVDEITVADLLGDLGYATGLVGKWHQGTVDRFHPIERGFDEFFGFLPGARSYFGQEPDGGNAASRRFAPDDERAQPRPVGRENELNRLYRGREPVSEPEYLTDAFAREAVDFVARHRERPFFLYVPLSAPHTPIEATTEYAERFADVEDPLRRTYVAMVSALDDAVGRILAALDEHRLAERTLVVFLSDNGCATYTEACTNDPLRLGKLFLFEGGVRVPFTLRYPARVPPGQVIEEPISALDLLPTMVALAGGTLPDDRAYDGVDLMPWLDGDGEPEASPHESLFWRNGDNRAIRHGSWKLFWNPRKDWLFDLEADVAEQRDRSAERPEVVAELKRRYAEWERQLVEPAWPSRPGRPQEIDGVRVDIDI